MKLDQPQFLRGRDLGGAAGGLPIDWPRGLWGFGDTGSGPYGERRRVPTAGRTPSSRPGPASRTGKRGTPCRTCDTAPKRQAATAHSPAPGKPDRAVVREELPVGFRRPVTGARSSSEEGPKLSLRAFCYLETRRSILRSPPNLNGSWEPIQAGMLGSILSGREAVTCKTTISAQIAQERVWRGHGGAPD